MDNQILGFVRALVRAAVNDLPPEQRRYVQLHFFDGLSYREIAERLNVTYWHVYTTIQQGLNQLHDDLGDNWFVQLYFDLLDHDAD